MFSRSHDGRLKRLAQKLEQTAELDRARERREEEVLALRRQAAGELHELCANFVASINKLVATVHLDLAPSAWETQALKCNEVNLIQINASGRIIQLSFQVTDALEERLDIRTPYTLHGSVRWFNQELLDRDDVREEKLYYCTGKNDPGWRFVEARSQKMGAVDEDYLASLIEQLLP